MGVRKVRSDVLLFFDVVMPTFKLLANVAYLFAVFVQIANKLMTHLGLSQAAFLLFGLVNEVEHVLRPAEVCREKGVSSYGRRDRKLPSQVRVQAQVLRVRLDVLLRRLL